MKGKWGWKGWRCD